MLEKTKVPENGIFFQDKQRPITIVICNAARVGRCLFIPQMCSCVITSFPQVKESLRDITAKLKKLRQHHYVL